MKLNAPGLRETFHFVYLCVKYCLTTELSSFIYVYICDFVFLVTLTFFLEKKEGGCRKPRNS